jgi:para-nitrobenzyl esterase
VRGFISTVLAALALTGAVGASSAYEASAPATSTAAAHSPVVRTDDGLLSGTVVSGTVGDAMNEFLGIPYAAPPVGPLRWQPPAPASRWSGVREATQFGANCAQPTSPYGIASTSENCLYLHVYAPREASADTRLPVMVWLHGGAFNFGESNDFNPAPLVAHGIIVVTINYRLGALGFLANSSLTGSDTDAASTGAGDYGLMDQQAALRWVQSNIGGFGGDRRQVTIAGQSAGGLSVLAQVISPSAKGLFARAIVESGTYQLVQNTLAAAESAGANFATTAGCGAATDIAACLRALPVSTVLADQNQAGYRPNVDPGLLPETLQQALDSGDYAHVPVLMGTNADEYSLFVAQDQILGHLPPVSAANYTAYIEGSLGVSAQTAAAIAAQYPVSAYASPALALTAVGTDGSFACNAVTIENALSSRAPLYGYEFSDPDAPQRYLPSAGFPYGAAHTSELSYLFDLTAPFPAQFTDAQLTLAAQMQAHWTSFVKDGRPWSPGATRWPAYDSGAHQVLSLNTPAPTRETDFSTEHDCSFWNPASSVG